jgi:hypothetical protein
MSKPEVAGRLVARIAAALHEAPAGQPEAQSQAPAAPQVPDAPPISGASLDVRPTR